jgi:succinoglycan biosynthesis protein ExoV
MKLYYFQHPWYDNVGDDLNKWMWPELLPGLPMEPPNPESGDEPNNHGEDDDALLVGIGTLLNDGLNKRVPKRGHMLVFGSGVGYGRGLPGIDDRWRFYCVRGPLSAANLGLPPETAVTDGAALLRRLRALPDRPVRYRFSYMPHAEFSYGAGSSWERICRDLGFGYISATWPFERVLDALAETEVLITEAMHGAIIADTMRVPWIAAQSNPIINPFKWEDWTRSVGLTYEPHALASLWEYPLFRRSWIKYTLERPHWLRMREIRRRLKLISRTAQPQLSREEILDARVDELEERLHWLRRDAEWLTAARTPTPAAAFR